MAIDDEQKDFSKRTRVVRGEGPSICEEADTLVNGPRRGEYGPYKDSLERICTIANAMLSKEEAEILDATSELTPSIVSKVLIALKLAREANKHKRDNLVDACGYLQLHGSLYE